MSLSLFGLYNLYKQAQASTSTEKCRKYFCVNTGAAASSWICQAHLLFDIGFKYDIWAYTLTYYEYGSKYVLTAYVSPNLEFAKT